MRVDDEQQRTAIHEAAHVVSAHLLGARTELVTIRPSRQWLGACFPEAREIDTSGMRVDVPLALQPRHLRDAVESRAIRLLSGPIAEELLSYESGYFGVTEDEQRAERLVAAVTLTAKEQTLLARGDSEIRVQPDEERAVGLALSLATERESAAYLAWLRATTRSLVYSEPFRRLLAALVPELLKHETLTGEQARAVFSCVEGGTLRKHELTTYDGAVVRPDSLYQCWQSFVRVDGVRARRGDLLRGDHPAVRAMPRLFVSAGQKLPRSEQVQALRAQERGADGEPLTRGASCWTQRGSTKTEPAY